MPVWGDTHLLPMSYVSYCTWKVWRGWCRLLGAPRVAGSTQPALGLCTQAWTPTKAEDAGEWEDRVNLVGGPCLRPIQELKAGFPSSCCPTVLRFHVNNGTLV